MLVQRFFSACLTAIAICAAGSSPAWGQEDLEENFDGVTGNGGAVILTGSGSNEIEGWDTGIQGEHASATAEGNTVVGNASAQGVPGGGVDGGAGQVQVSGVSFALLYRNFNDVSGTGGGQFLAGDGTPDTQGYTPGWDYGFRGEAAFAGTKGGAAVDEGGGAYAEGLPTGGNSGTGGARISMSDVTVGSGWWYAGMECAMGSFPGADPLLNSGFDDDGGSLANWAIDGPGWNTLVVPGWDVGGADPLSGSHVLKMYGQFTGSDNVSTVYQDLTAEAGQVWELNAFAQQSAWDLLGANNYLDMGIEFYNDSDGLVGSTYGDILDGGSQEDVWISADTLQLEAPGGTVIARAVLRFHQPNGTDGGSGLIDNVGFKVVGATNVNLADFTITVDVKGEAGGAGEVLGDYQLRIEDTDGNRLVLHSSGPASGGWETVSGLLSEAEQADADGVPTPGAFNVNSAYYKVIVAFDNEAAGGTAWGTGGTLYVDNLILPTGDSTGSDWTAGLLWHNVSVAESDMSRITVLADVLGSDVGGGYALDVLGMESISAGIDEGFAGVSGDCGAGGDCWFLDRQDWLDGVDYAYTTDWETTIAGEGGYAGYYGIFEIYEYEGRGGFAAQGIANGGTDGTGGGEIRAEGLIIGAGGGWYAGLDWKNQGLASSDLSEVTLHAWVKGTAKTGGTLGTFELRLEDAELDRLYFPATADGGWQFIGGTLDNALQGGALGGGGSGEFDLDSPTYTVVVSFTEEADTWRVGGALEVDGLFLSAVESQREVGRVTFQGTADGSTFQTIGGLLSTGETTFGDNEDDLEGALGTGGGEFYQAGGGGGGGGTPWDDGLENAYTFAGVWGTGVLGTVTAEACTDCGIGGSKAGQLTVTGAVGGETGGWWAGMYWVEVRVDLRAGAGDNLAALSGVEFHGKVKGTIEAGDGQTYGAYTFRLEDDETDFLAFDFVANGGWQTAGGPLSEAYRGQTPDGNGVFNYNQETYHAVLVYAGPAEPGWGTGGTLTIDNILTTGISFGDADVYSVAVRFDDSMETWGTDGTLTVDNVVLSETCAFLPAGTVCDDDVVCTINDVCTGGGGCAGTYQQRQFGDLVPPFCPSECPQPNVQDIMCLLDDFADGPAVTGCLSSEPVPPCFSDLSPCPEDRPPGYICPGSAVIDIDDILAVLDSFGQNFPCEPLCP